jgi:hypothetical protein
MQSQAQTVALAEPWTLSWRVTNAFAAQPVRFRLEALMAAALPAQTNSVLLADWTKAGAESWKHTSATGVTFDLTPATGADDPGALLVATNAGKVPQKAAWVRLEKRFEPLLNVKEHQALALEIVGDGSGALLAVRLETPHHLAYGAVADRYVSLDFTGRRLVTLVETESSRWSDYVWNDGKHPYHVYRETIRFDAVDSASVWVQNLAPGRETKLRIGAIRALPMRSATVKNPRVTVAGMTLEFPVELASGSWIEGNGPDDCVAYGLKGELLQQVAPRGDWPTLPAGAAPLEFTCEAGEGSPPRARVTVFAHGEGL